MAKKTMNNFFKKLAEKDSSPQPDLVTCSKQPDLVTCSNCHKTFKLEDCETEEDGDWETGYYLVFICPNCEDGGCLDNYTYSNEQ